MNYEEFPSRLMLLVSLLHQRGLLRTLDQRQLLELEEELLPLVEYAWCSGQDSMDEASGHMKCVGFKEGKCTYCSGKRKVYCFEWSWFDDTTMTASEEWDDICEDCLSEFLDNEINDAEDDE